jgi:hypothetical protein
MAGEFNGYRAALVRPANAGTDFVIPRDGRLAAVCLFFDS